ncbi:MAG TPA: BlaI/MecI/CopY family transcriptional regulator [Victivallales bacterium]|nr:BlaI/MecI/CopY family transcriptional regulator [Victivallales bacterium]
MKKVPNISEAEWEVMKVLWKRNPMTAQEIICELRETEWHPKTVKTLIARLVKKGAVGYKSEGRTYLYSPLIKEKSSVIRETQSLLDRLFGGSLAPMVAQFVESKKLSNEELDELSRILKLSDSSKNED